MATVNLGRIKFVWQGAYSGATAYVADDVVSYNGSSYICILASTGNLPTNATYWNLMAQTGTDITSIAGLAQGDVLYYNGTSWVRLGAGTSGQVLTTQGSGANPQWSTVSSDFVKLATAQASASSYITFNGQFSPTYDTYKVIAYDVQMSTSNGRLGIQLAHGVSYTYVTSSIYAHFTQGGYMDANGGSGDGNWYDAATNTEWQIRFDQGTDANRTALYDINFYNFNSTSTTYKNYLGITHRNNSSWSIANMTVSGYATDSTLTSNAITGLRFSNYNGTITKGKFVLYGLKGI
jgi:hypothetical protein